MRIRGSLTHPPRLAAVLASAAALFLFGCTGQIGESDLSAGQFDDGPHVKEGPAPVPDAPKGAAPTEPAACAPPVSLLARLTPEQYARTVRAAVPDSTVKVEDLAAVLPPRQGRFSNDVGELVMSEPFVTQLFQVARKLGDEAVVAWSSSSPCLAMAKPDIGCATGFVEGLAAKLFRRPLTSAERDDHLARYARDAQTHGAPTSLRLAATVLFLSPHALFRTELGSGSAATVALDAAEKASALSYFVADGPPDAELLAAARNGQLSTPQELAAQTRRLLATAPTSRGVLKFLSETFGVREVMSKTKEFTLFRSWTLELAADLARESELFLESVLGEGDARLATLFTADFTWVNARTAPLYGLQGTGEFSRVALPPTRAAGLLVQPSLMANLAHDDDTAPVARGKFIREILLCQDIPTQPPELDVVPPPPDGKRTQRQRLAEHSVEACAFCHRLMDPLGLAFENYDAIGSYRTTEAKKPIDASGTLTSARPEGAQFRDAVELGRLLSTSPDVARCFARTLFTYALGRDVRATDECAVQRIARRFDETGGDLRDLVVAVTSDESFFNRARTSGEKQP